ncbi:unnamed protein product, partial [Ixodes persulcatus]
SAPTAATKESANVPAGLHAMQCADESCESETSYMKHLFSSGKDPCADFYDFVCSNWKTQNALPPNRRRWAVQDLLVQKIEGAVYWFLEDFARIYKDLMGNVSMPTTKLFALLKSCEDIDAIDLRGFAPFRHVLRHLYLDGWPLPMGQDTGGGKDPDLEEIAGMMVRDLSLHPLAFVGVRAGRPGAPTLQVILPLCNLRNSFFFLKEPSGSHGEVASRCFADRGRRTGVAACPAVRLRCAVAKSDAAPEPLDSASHFVRISSRYWSWPAFLSALFDDDAAVTSNATVLVKSPKFLEKLMKILQTSSKSTLLNYLGYRVMCALAVFLPSKAHFLAKLHWDRRYGYKELPERWRVCLRTVDAVMRLTTYALHFENYVKKNSQNFRNHLSKFGGVVSALTSFFKDYSKSRMDDYALCNYKLGRLRLESFAPNISKALNLDAAIYDSIPLVEDGNALEGYYVARSHVSRSSWDAAISGAGDLGWKRSVFDLACTYNPTVNSFELPLSLFHEPFFYNDDTLPFDDPRVTFRIGRELAKVCPQNGIVYDPDRDHAVWQEPPGNASIADDAKCLIEQYSNITVHELNMTMDGMSTLPENILDNIVLPPLYEAYREAHSSSLKEHTIHHIDGTAFNQVFFLSYALGLCENMDKGALRDLLLEGRSSPAKYRVNVPLQNFNKFGKIFGCPPGTPMNPLRKCTVWMKHD